MKLLQRDFSSVECVEENANEAMQYMQKRYNKTVCPHTATAVHAVRNLKSDNHAETVIVETAHPAKFSDAVLKATGVTPSVPAHVSSSLELEESCQSVSTDLDSIQLKIAEFFSATAA